MSCRPLLSWTSNLCLYCLAHVCFVCNFVITCSVLPTEVYPREILSLVTVLLSFRYFLLVSILFRYLVCVSVSLVQ